MSLKKKIEDYLHSGDLDLRDVTATDIKAVEGKFIIKIEYTYDSEDYDDDIDVLCGDNEDHYEEIYKEVAEKAICPINVPIESQTADFCGYMYGINQFTIFAMSKPLTASEVLKIKYNDDVFGYIIKIVEE